MAPLLALLLAFPALSAPLCSGTERPRPRVGVIVSSFPTIVEHSQPWAALQDLQTVKHPRGLPPQGLTVAEYRLRYSADLEGACGEGCAATCAWLRSFTVDVTPLAVRIHVPREYRPGSCEYERIMEHERAHDRLHRRRLGELAQNLRDALAHARSRRDLMGPVEARDRGAAFELLTERLERVLRPVYEAHLRLLRAENAALDSEAEYRRLGRSCDGWRGRRY